MVHDEFHEVSTEAIVATPKESAAWPAFISTNATLLAWLVFLGFGGALLTFYHSHINYFPELEWNQAFSYLVALTVLGGGAAAIYSCTLFIPGFIWSELLIFDTDLRNHFCYTDSKPNEPCFLTIWKDLALPFSVFMIVIHVPMYWASTLSVALVSAFGLVALFFVYRAKFKKITRHWKESPEKKSRRVKYLASAVTAALLSSASLLCLYSFVVENGYSAPLILICTIFVIASNILVAVQFRNKPGRAVLTGIVAALVLLFLGESLPGQRASTKESMKNGYSCEAEDPSSECQWLSTRIMTKFGLGGPYDKTLALTTEGCKILASQGFAAKPVDGGGILQNVRLLSRLGTEYYIETQTEDKKKVRRFALPKSLVRSWSIEVPTDSQAQQSSQSAGSGLTPAVPNGPSS